MPDYERVLYAALAPSPQTSVILKSACRTWEDHLWAQISIMCEEKETMETMRLGGSFWEGGLAAVEKGVTAASREEEEKEEEEWEKEVAGTLEGLKNIAVADGSVSFHVYPPRVDDFICRPLSDHAFHFSQLQIILNRTNTLLDVFADGLRDGSYSQMSFE
jgi:nuclear pore complex protein Nup107